MGDLGGLDTQGKEFFLFDLEFSQFKKSFACSYRYNAFKNASFHGKVFYGTVSGSDALTRQPQRTARNLSFKSNIIECSASYEYFIFKSKPGHLYHIKGTKATNPNPLSLYVFAGVGGFYFNPKAEYNGSYVALQPLGTEGQGISGKSKKYSRISVSIPTGMGMSLRLWLNFKLSMDMSYNFTFTDYLDDVSGLYFDNDQIRFFNGDAAADLANRADSSAPSTWSQAGAIRGNSKNNDAFLSTVVSLTYTFMRKNPVPRRPKKHSFQN